MKKKHSNFDNEVKSYKWVKLKEDPPKNAVLYVLDPVTKEIELFITDKNGVPRTVSTVISSININDYVASNPNNEIQVQNNQLYVKKYNSGDEYINIVSTPIDYKITLNTGKLELLENKQDDLTHDGTGTKYPTVDAINEALSQIVLTPGKSAYEIALENGFVGTEQEWLESLKGEDGLPGVTPHIDPITGNWFIGNVDTGVSAQGEQGIQGEPGPKGDKGDQGPAGADGDIGPQGPKGDKGDKGDVGEQGIQGPIGLTGEKGEKGDKGDTGEQGIQGPKGDNGVSPHIGSNGNWFIGTLDTGVKAQGQDGKSAYQLWLEAGNTGTFEDFLNSIRGYSAYEVAVINGFVGTEVQWLQSLIGEDGLSAYQLWLQQGNIGTVQDFLDSLRGQDGYTPIKGVDYFDGEDGESAYQIWLDLGNSGTEQDFINSLRGVDGTDGSVVTIGSNNNWYIDGVDTGIKAVGIDGQDGYTPIKGVDYFDGQDGYTPVKGIDYFDGIDGNTWYGGANNPSSGLGDVGDWYVNSTTWDVFEKTNTTTWTLRGNIKGGKGDDGQDGIAGVISQVTANVNNTVGIPNVIVTLGGTAQSRTIHLDFQNLKGEKGEDGKGVRIVGTLPNPGSLPTPPANTDDSYLIDGDLWVWDTVNNTWINVGNIQGPAGPPGPANSLSIGTVVSGTTASATITGTAPSQTLNLVLPKGDNAPTYSATNGIQLNGTVFSPVYGNTVGTVAQGDDPRFHNAVTIGTANGLSLSNQVLSLGLASATSTGALSQADWIAFNSKASANDGNITYSGTGAIVGGGTSSANQSTNTTYTFDLSQVTKDNIDLGVIANSWGDHSTFNYATQTWVTSNFAQIAHTHLTSHITALTGYTLGTNSPLTTSDTLNQALGKLQAQINSKGGVTSITAGAGLSGGTITSSGTIALNSATIASLNLANSALQSGDNISELINDAGYITSASIPIYTAGTGISISPSYVITNTAPNINQTLSFVGGVLTLSNGGGSVTIPNDNTITRLRGTATGTYTSGDLTLLAGSNITITQSGANFTIASTNTTYGGGTLAQLNASTPDSTNRVWSPSILNQWLNGKGYLTTETDPIFTASPAFGITAGDITNWNNKQNALTAGANIQIIGNTISATDTIYTLPIASASTLGGIRVGSNLTIDSNGILSATNTNVTQTLSITGRTVSLSAGGGSVTIPFTAWADIPNKPTTFPPSAHTHTTAQVTALTGYVLGTNTVIGATDSLNVALGKIQAQINAKTSNTGTVTSITAGTGLSGGTITTSGTIALNSTTLASLALADTALQSGDNISELINDVGYITSSSLPVVNNGSLNVSTTTDLVGGFTFTANQSGNTNTTIGLSTNVLNAIVDGQTAFGWGNHAGLYVPVGRTITINGVAQNLSANRTWTIPDNDTITRLRGTTSGTYTSGDLTLLAGANTTITQSGANITIASTNTNTTYTAGTGLSLTGTVFGQTITTSGTGSFVTGVTQTANGFQVNLGTPPNTTYTTDTLTILNTGTSTTGALQSSKNLNDWLNGKGFSTQTLTAGTNINIVGNVISAVDTNTTYSAGAGLTLSGTTFSLPITYSGTGNYVSAITQTTNGLTVTRSTLPTFTDAITSISRNGVNIPIVSQNVDIPIFNTTGAGLVPERVGSTTTRFLREDGTWVIPTNTTYSTGSLAELNTGTVATGRIWGANVLNQWLNAKGFITSYVDTITRLGTATGNLTSGDILVVGSGSVSASKSGNTITLTGLNQMQNLVIGNTSGDIGINLGGNVVNMRSLGLVSRPNANINPYSGGGLIVYDGGTTNYPSTIGTGLTVGRGVATGSFDIWKANTADGKVKLRADQGSWENIATEPWVLSQIPTLPTNYWTTNSTQTGLTGNKTTSGIITSTGGFVGSLTGNASTATALATARTINGTSFDGTANIVTANWGTARNITIGNTTKSVNGSGNYSWSLAEIGIPTALDFITTNTNQTGLSGDKTTSGIWTFNSIINTANHGNSSQWKQAYDWVSLGGVSRTSVLLNSSNDLDLVVEPGYYHHTGGSSPSNKPIGGGIAGYLEVVNSGSNNFIRQTWRARDFSYEYQRTRSSGNVWSAWVEYITTDNLDSQATSLGFIKSSALPTVNNGQLTLSTGTGLTGSATFTANQSGGSTFSVAVASTHKLPTTAEWAAALVNTTYTGSNGINVTGTVISPTYGTAANTIAQGNDSRINNGQTAFSWGNHANKYTQWLNAVTGADITTPSTSRFNPDATNPVASAHFAGITYGNGSNVTGQLFTHFTTGESYLRGYNTSFSAWRKIWDSGNFDPAQYVQTSRTITAGNGLSGGGNLTANRTITLGTPSSIGLSTTNAVTASSHTHALDSATTTAINQGVTAHGWGDFRDYGLGTVFSNRVMSNITHNMPAGLYASTTSTSGVPIPNSGSYIALQSGVASGSSSYLWLSGNNSAEPRAFISHTSNTGVQTDWRELWHDGNLTNVSQLNNDAGYLTSSTANYIAIGNGSQTGTSNGNADTLRNGSVWSTPTTGGIPSSNGAVVSFNPYSNGAYGFQLGARSNKFYGRTLENGTLNSWVEFIHTGNISSNLSGYVQTSRTLTAGNGLTGGGNLTANRTITLGTPSAITLSSTNSVTTSSHTHAFTPGGTTAQYIRGDGSLATMPTFTDAITTISRNGVNIPIVSQNVDIPVFSTSGAGLVPARVGSVATKYLREDGTWVTPANTTYSNMSIAELNTGTVTTGRIISASVLNQWLTAKGYVTTDTVTRLRGTTAGTYTSGDLTLLAGANTTITQSGATITIASTNTNTTYSGSTSIILSGTSFQRAALTGDVTATQNSNATTIANSAVTNAKMANMPANTFKGRLSTTGAPQDLTVAQMQSILGIGGGSGIESIYTDNSAFSGPANDPEITFNFHEYWGFPAAFAEEYQPGNATAKANREQLNFFASYDSVQTIEAEGEADVTLNGYHITNVLLMSPGGDVYIEDGVYAGDQVNVTTLPNQQINIYVNKLIATVGNEVWTFVNLVWDCEQMGWVITGYGTP